MRKSPPQGGFGFGASARTRSSRRLKSAASLKDLGAHLAAERHPTRSELDAMRACVAEMDDVARQGTATSAGIADYAALNDGSQHRLLVHLARSPNLTRQLDRASALPFASPSSLLLAQSRLVDLPTMLIVAQDQHRCIVDYRRGGRNASRGAHTGAQSPRHASSRPHLAKCRGSAACPGHTLITGTSRKPISATN